MSTLAVPTAPTAPTAPTVPTVLHSPGEAVAWFNARGVKALHADSRHVTPGDGFIAWPGAATDGRQHVAAALARGAVACLVEQQGVEAFDFGGAETLASIASFDGLKRVTGPIAALFYGKPSDELEVLAITGTNGKTSTAWWLAQALSRSAGSTDATPVAHGPCGMVGTLGIGIPPDLVYTGLTTPDPVLWQRELRNFADRGFGACAIEASSIGIAERRLDGTRIAVAVFTNFTQDHLDYHGSMDDYWQAKAELFRWPGLGAAVVNVDDAHGQSLVTAMAATAAGPALWTVSAAGGPARLVARAIGYGADGLRFDVVEDGLPPEHLDTALIGQYNVANLLGVIGTLRALGRPLHEAVAACRDLSSVPGRMERIALPGQPLAVVDYAHTPDALDKALAGLRPLAARRGGALWCLFGCGGERDAAKRPLMGAVAQARADHVIVTSDNPRSEAPAAIISQILRGLSNADAVQVEADRAIAIASVLARAAPEDVVLIAGRGHEAWQEVNGARIAFSDRTHAADALTARTQR